jgi:neurofibromin 1
MDADALIHSLIARLGNKLSHSAGARLETIEANPLVQQTVRSLIDLSQYKIDVTVSTLLRLLDTGAKVTY